MSLTDLLVPTCIHMLGTLSGLLKKAHLAMPGAEVEILLLDRLAPDMLPLSSQVRFACLQAQEMTVRLRGEPLPVLLSDLALEGYDGGSRPGSISDAQAWIDQTLSLLGSVEPDALDAGVATPVTLELPAGVIFYMTGKQYARDWALPQFYFHIVTAYAILRSRGVDVGKADYVPHMFAYIQPASTE